MTKEQIQQFKTKLAEVTALHIDNDITAIDFNHFHVKPSAFNRFKEALLPDCQKKTEWVGDSIHVTSQDESGLTIVAVFTD
jgi:hypothetical protein